MLKLYSLDVPPEAALLWRMYNRYGWHQALLRFFGDSTHTTLLWRVNKNKGLGGNCTVLTDADLVETNGLDLLVRVKPFPEDFLNRDVYRFSVECSPRVCEGATGRKLPLPIDDAVPWFVQRQESWGFSTSVLHLENWSIARFHRKGHLICLPEAEFSGVLTVTDREKFIRSALRGIGGKSTFGFGFLQLAAL